MKAEQFIREIADEYAKRYFTDEQDEAFKELIYNQIVNAAVVFVMAYEKIRAIEAAGGRVEPLEP